MSLKITRRPYTACAYRWALSTSGVSVGEGDCSESQCAELNGDVELDFSACASRHGKLVWAGDCAGGSVRVCSCAAAVPCCSMIYTFDLSGIEVKTVVDGEEISDCSAAFNRTFVLRGRDCHDVEDPEQEILCGLIADETPRGRYHPINPLPGAGPSLCAECQDESPFPDPVSLWSITNALADTGAHFLISPALGGFASFLFPDYAYELTSGVLGDASLVFSRIYGAFGNSCGDYNTTFPPTITMTKVPFVADDGTTGPETNDRIRSKWHLEYDIEATLWTLRSFNRLDYPIYTLSDSDPCDGDSKTLKLVDKGDAVDGCGIAPAEVTITRKCPPDRAAKSALLEDRKINGTTGKVKRQCGCDCQDEVNDLRHTCETKCGGVATGGCEECSCASDITWTVTLPSNIVPGHGIEPIPAGTYDLTHDIGCVWKHIGFDGGNQFVLTFSISGGTPSLLIQGSDSGLCCFSVATITGAGPVSCDGSAIVVDTATQVYTDSTGVPSSLSLSPSASCPATDGDTGGPYNTAEGCENYPDEPATACLYPEAINCCEHTKGKDVPCAYTAEFECDIFFDDEGTRRKIAAKQVTLRRKCYFENECSYMAVGAESSTGGSPVMDVDGFPGAQPVCATCEDLCLTGCTWDAWKVAECPEDEACAPKCNYCWSLDLGVITLGPDSVYAGGTIELLRISSTPAPNEDGYAVSEEFSGDGGYRLIAQVRVVECEVSAVIYITGTSSECASPLDGDIQIAYGELGGQPLGCPQSPMTACPEEITITRCATSDRNCTGLDVVAPSSLTFTRIACP